MHFSTLITQFITVSNMASLSQLFKKKDNHDDSLFTQTLDSGVRWGIVGANMSMFFYPLYFFPFSYKVDWSYYK